MHADIREAQLRQVEISRTAEMDESQATTNAYVQVPESVLNAERHNRIRYVVANTDDTNGIAAKVMGRIKDAAGGWSDWQDDPDANMAAADIDEATSDLLYTDNVAFDQYAVYVKSHTDDNHGEADVKGKSFFLET